ncbi:MAG: hypothetical protein WBA74_17965, partial [Cyclobacteriaceae bacterium]
LSRWEKERKRAYYGSPDHFFSTLIGGNTEESGFKLIEIIKKPNLNRPTVEEVKAAREKIKQSRVGGIVINKDSEEMRVIARSREPEFITYTNNLPYPPDSLITRKNGKVFLDFPNIIEITYQNEPAEVTYSGTLQSGKYQNSRITLTEGPTEILPNGAMADPRGILFEGYMGWEKLADILPIDYNILLEK